MANSFSNLLSFYRNFIFPKSIKSTKGIVTKVRVFNFSAEENAHWSTHVLVAAVICVDDKVANPKSISSNRHAN